MKPAVLVLAIGLAASVAIACSSSDTGPDAAPGAGARPAALRVPELGPVPPLTAPEGDALTQEKIQLGADLFFDVRLSGSGHTSCNSCHVSLTNWQDSLPRSAPDRSYPSDEPMTGRNTPSFMNVLYAPVVRWDGSHTDLVEALALPFAEPNMNTARLPSGSAAIDVGPAQQSFYQKVTGDFPGYIQRYSDAFGVDITQAPPGDVWRLTGRAIRAFLSLASSRDAPFDRWNAGDDAAMDASAVRGLELFRGKGKCISCHSGPFFTDFGFHNLSISAPDAGGVRPDEGRYLVSGQPEDKGKFLTPSLRQVYDTGPYFHDGSRGSLRDVLHFFASPEVTADPNHDPLFSTPLDLNDAEINDLIAFLKALRGAPMAPLPTPQTP